MQRFWVMADWIFTGERWQVSHEARDPEHALEIFLRRKYVREALLSEQPVKFVVSHEPILM